jgi:hypothetical protein
MTATLRKPAPRFALGDHVVTQHHGPGEIVLVYPVARGVISYGVSIAKQRAALVCREDELTAAPHVPLGNTVRCIDCIHARKSNYLHNTVRCAAFARAKSAQSQRLCNRYAPIATGAVVPTHPLETPEA